MKIYTYKHIIYKHGSNILKKMSHVNKVKLIQCKKRETVKFKLIEFYSILFYIQPLTCEDTKDKFMTITTSDWPRFGLSRYLFKSLFEQAGVSFPNYNRI